MFSFGFAVNQIFIFILRFGLVDGCFYSCFSQVDFVEKRMIRSILFGYVMLEVCVLLTSKYLENAGSSGDWEQKPNVLNGCSISKFSRKS